MRQQSLAALLLLFFLGNDVAAQEYPNRAITLIVPFTAGGPSDALGRAVAQAMSGPLGQQVIVENLGGAGGTIGAAKGASASPDGYTITLTHIGQATSVTLYRKLSYDPVGAFDTIGMIGEVPMTIIGRKDLPPGDARELISFIRAQRKNISFGNAGIGSASHLCGLLFMTALNAEMHVIPYRGSGPAMTDLLGGRIDLQCDQTTTTLPHIRGGAIKAYASTLKNRLPSLPDLPTLAESGLADFELAVWYGLLVPKGTPGRIVDRLGSALRAAAADPLYTRRLSDFGVSAIDGERAGRNGFAEYFRAEVGKWAPIIRAAGSYAD
jgi:tripartite-type tricarboxylate transporter receptor subunit TctC